MHLNAPLVFDPGCGVETESVPSLAAAYPSALAHRARSAVLMRGSHLSDVFTE